METSDAEAAARARGGDTEAFRVLVERHSRLVFRVAYRLTGNEHDAETAPWPCSRRSWVARLPRDEATAPSGQGSGETATNRPSTPRRSGR